MKLYNLCYSTGIHVSSHILLYNFIFTVNNKITQQFYFSIYYIFENITTTNLYSQKIYFARKLLLKRVHSELS